MKIYKLLPLIMLFFIHVSGCTDSSYITFPDTSDAVENTDVPFSDTLEDVDETKAAFLRIPSLITHPIKLYPLGPHAIEKFQVMPNMTFYDPWNDDWIELSDYYLSKDIKALFIVSSAGWCGPCLMESAALINIYEKYHDDGLEIVYTLGNTNVPGDVPFETSYDKPDSADFSSDLQFMENWKHMASTEAGKYFNYPIYADPKREFLPYKPNHAWPLSMLVTTKDMGVRLVEEGFWSALVENKIEMVLYSDVPNIPFE